MCIRNEGIAMLVALKKVHGKTSFTVLKVTKVQYKHFYPYHSQYSVQRILYCVVTFASSGLEDELQWNLFCIHEALHR